jgi:hypothetical protein
MDSERPIGTSRWRNNGNAECLLGKNENIPTCRAGARRSFRRPRWWPSAKAILRLPNPAPSENLFIMRQLLFIAALLGVLGFTQATQAQLLKTNSMRLGPAGTLEAFTPPDWTLVQTNLGMPNFGPIFELHGPRDSITIRLYTCWDGFNGKSIKPNEADMGTIVSNIVATQYLPVAKEKTFDLEKLKGPGVNGVYARVTDSKWTILEKNSYPNIADGMFRCGNIWGNFDLLTPDKDGPLFKSGLRVMETLRRKP